MARRKTESEPREHIITVATEVFATQGFAGARVDDIAERAGINKAMLYYHLGDKQALYAAVLLDTIDKALAMIDAALEKANTPEERIRAIIQTVAAAAQSNPNFPPLMLRELASGGASLPDPVMRRMARLFRTMSETLAAGERDGRFRNVDPVMTHMAIMGSLMVLTAGAPIRRRIRAIVGGPKEAFVDRTAADIAAHVSDLILEGLEKRARPAARRRSAK